MNQDLLEVVNQDTMNKDLLEAVNQGLELPLNSVRVDGEMTANKLMLQLQADILGIKLGKVVRIQQPSWRIKIMIFCSA